MLLAPKNLREYTVGVIFSPASPPQLKKEILREMRKLNEKGLWWHGFVCGNVNGGILVLILMVIASAFKR